MTEKNFQISDKAGDMIYVVRGDTIEELTINHSDLMGFIQTVKGSVPSAGQSNGSTEVVDIETVVLAQGGENPRWAVKGGNFKTHGITMWKEPVEEAGLTLDPMKENKLPGWKAEYDLKPKEDGSGMTPRKVIKLIPPGGEQSVEQPEKKGVDRPMSPETLKAALTGKAAKFGAKTASPAMRKFLAGMLNGMLGDDTARHAFLYWLNGTQSMNDCPDGMCYALSAWIDADDEYNPNKFADVEAKAAYNFIMEEQGQQKFDEFPAF